MLEQYITNLLANSSFRYSAALLAVLRRTGWRTVRRVIQRLLRLILLLCAICIVVHCYFGTPYSEIFAQVRSLGEYMWQTTLDVIGIVREFLTEVRRNFA